MSPATRTRVLRSAIAAACAAIALVAIIGFAHTPAGRPLRPLLRLVLRATPGGCPLGYDVSATPAQREAARTAFAASHRGPSIAVARPALGFVLDRTTKSEVEAWAQTNGVACVKPRGGHDLECSNVSGALVPASMRGASLRSLWLDFGAGERLLAVTTVRRDASAAVVSAAFDAVTRDLALEAGAPSSTDGDASAASLASGALRQASAEFRFQNYYALTRATNMGDGYVLTEVYRSLG